VHALRGAEHRALKLWAIMKWSLTLTAYMVGGLFERREDRRVVDSLAQGVGRIMTGKPREHLRQLGETARYR
jgi:hypothetical protein